MPIYEYECPNCSYALVKEKKMSERTTKEICPKCKKTMEQQISISSFHLKGDGWYVTDYKNKKKDGS